MMYVPSKPSKVTIYVRLSSVIFDARTSAVQFRFGQTNSCSISAAVMAPRKERAGDLDPRPFLSSRSPG